LYYGQSGIIVNQPIFGGKEKNREKTEMGTIRHYGVAYIVVKVYSKSVINFMSVDRHKNNLVIM